MKIRNIELSGEIKKSNIRSRGRFRFCLICLFLGFSLILLKITHLSILYNKNANPSVVNSHQAKNIIDHKRIIKVSQHLPQMIPNSCAVDFGSIKPGCPYLCAYKVW